MPEALPRAIPVMTLPETVFFPRTVLPLHIFEPRYREMLRDTLAGHRIFAVAALDARRSKSSAELEPPQRIATAGVIRVCQKNENGTSDLLLEGLARVEILSIVREQPYRMIRVRPLCDATAASADDLGQLRRDLLRAVNLRIKLGESLPPGLNQALRTIEDAAVLCDLLVFSLVSDAAFKQRMLETIDTAQRLQHAIARFRQDAAVLRLQRRLQATLGDDEIEHN